MNGNNSTRALVNTALSAAVAVIIAVIGLFVPFLSFASFLWPVPVVIAIKRYGFKYGVYVTVVSGLIVGMISQPLYALYVILGFGAIGLAIGVGVERNYSASITLVITSIASLLSKLLLVIIVTRIMGVNPIRLQIEAMEKSLEITTQFYKNIGLDQVEDIKDIFMNSLELIKLTIPAVLIFASVLDSFLNYTLSGVILKRFKLNMKPFPPFAEWRFPSNAALGFLLLVALTYIGRYLGLQNTQVIMANIFLIFNLVFLIQGLAVVYHYMLSRGLPKFARILIVILALFNHILALVTVFIGLLDVIFDFRKLCGGK